MPDINNKNGPYPGDNRSDKAKMKNPILKIVPWPSSLLAKIFLSFCVYIIIVFVSVFYLSVVYSGFSSVGITDQAILLYGQLLVDGFENLGIASARASVKRIESKGAIKILLYDSLGNSILGTSSHCVDEAQVQKTLKKVNSHTNGNTKPVYHHMVLYKKITGQSGRYYVVVAEPTCTYSEAIFSEYTISRFTVFIAVAIVFSYLLSAYLTKPIRLIHQATKQLAAGDLSIRIKAEKYHRSDELIHLANEFDRMAERIETLEDARSQFLSAISHELRSPITRLSLSAEIIRSKAIPGINRHLDKIALECERLNDIIDRLITVTQDKNIFRNFHFGRIDLDALANEIVNAVKPQAEKKQCPVILKSHGKMEIIGIHHLIKSALENVIQNAVRYTIPGTNIDISVEKDTSKDAEIAIITVKDHGKGVPEALLDKIFEPFFRVDSSRDRKTGGTGIGLAIAHRAIRFHKGKITAVNSPEGGLKIQIILPVLTTFLSGKMSL